MEIGSTAPLPQAVEGPDTGARVGALAC